MSNIRQSIIALTLGAAASLHAGAQSTLPPPPKRPALPEYTPPAQRERAPATANQGKPNTATPKFDPTTVEFTPIWHKLSDGTVVGPDDYYEIAALKNNPMIDEDLWSFIEVLLEDRHKEMDFVAQAHPRQCVKALTTAIANFDINDKSTQQALGDVAMALNQPGGFIGYLVEQGMISQDMGTMSHHIATDYTFTMMQSIKDTAPDGATNDEVTNIQSKFLLRHGLSEPLEAFGRLSRRAIESNPSLVENADDILALKGDDFLKAAAAALAPLSDEELRSAITRAYEDAHGPIGG